MKWRSSNPSCTCFSRVPTPDLERLTLTPHPLLSECFYIDGEQLHGLLLPEGRVLLTAPTLEQECPVHDCPPLAAPADVDLVALQAFQKALGLTPPAFIPTGFHDHFSSQSFPLFGALTRKGSPVISTEPHQGLTLIGAIRPPFVYIHGAGGFHVDAQDQVELAVLSCISTKESTPWTLKTS